MDNREAQFVLSAYRPGGQDAASPQFTEALAQARRDPSLQRWFNESSAFDRAVTEKLCAVEAPAGLREGILVGGKVSHRSSWTKPLLKWSIAAALVLAAIAGSWVLRESARPRLVGWQTNALGQISALVEGRAKFDTQSDNPGELVAWLHANRAAALQKLPEKLERLKSLGCKTFFWDGQPVSVICFQRENGGLIHLVTMKAAAPFNRASKNKPKFVQQGNWATATWCDGATVYMLALEGQGDQIRSYLL